MLFCENAKDSHAGFDDLAVFVSQLRAAGVEACIGTGSVPPELARGAIFDAAAHVRKGPIRPGDSLLLVQGHELDDQGLARLRRLRVPEGLRITVFGRFPSFQAEIGAKMKLSCVLDGGLELHDVPAGLGAGRHHLPVFGVRQPRAPGRDNRPTVLLLGPDLEKEAQAQALLGLGLSPLFRPVVLTDGNAKQAWASRFGHGIAFYQYGEVLPAAMASMADLCLILSAPSSSYRLQSLIANLAVQGVPLVDCSPGWGHAKYAAAMLQGPSDLNAVGTWLGSGILASLGMIGREVARSRFAAALDGGEALAALRRPADPANRPAPPVRDRARLKEEAPVTSRPLVFVPTNGVGLGHAQRCSLIAAEIGRHAPAPAFAAFPSCMRMLKSYGFDVMPLMSRSPLHRQEHENDLVNYLRLRRLTAGGRTLVFDGGYVFDSIYRSVLENRLSGVWIRRGLWQEGQSNAIALDREKVFRRVIVPSEAFEELNGSYSAGSHVHTVGPVVQAVRLSAERREAIRSEIAARFGVGFRHLAVTMLGGGVAADRSAQLSAICAMMAGRPDTLHLVIVWPTATVEAGAFAWPNTRIVKTHHASVLVAASDLYISAVGYNSFHEVLYNRVPTIFMAQMAAYMDDQRRRAMAAVGRGLAGIVEPHEMLSLRGKVTDVLDGGLGLEFRERLRDLDLPEPGNAEAAHLIMEVTECPRAAGRTSWPASPGTTPRISTTSSATTILGPGSLAPTSFPMESA